MLCKLQALEHLSPAQESAVGVCQPTSGSAKLDLRSLNINLVFAVEVVVVVRSRDLPVHRQSKISLNWFCINRRK